MCLRLRERAVANETDTEKKREVRHRVLCDRRKREAREAGFIREDGKSRILKKTVDRENGLLIMAVDWEEENREKEEENADV